MGPWGPVGPVMGPGKGGGKGGGGQGGGQLPGPQDGRFPQELPLLEQQPRSEG